MHDNMASADEPASMECILKSELFPKKSLVCEDDSLQVPFPLLCGEAVEYLGRTADGVIALSNFRLLVRSKDSFINIPLGMVELVECREIFSVNIYCKDATVVRCDFSTNDSCQDWFKRITQRTSIPKELSGLFAFAFFAWCQDRSPCPSEHEVCYQLCQQAERFTFSFGKEVERMKFDLKSKSSWRITYINEDFSVCSSYPKCHIVPACITDKHLGDVAGFRAQRRFPSVVWRDQRNGAVLVRCSQPELGWLGWRSTEDEKMLESVPLACSQNPGTYTKYLGINDDSSGSESGSQNGDVGTAINTENKKMIIMDCRSYSAAVANRAKGGGVECAEYYQNSEIQFMNLANIHTIRKSYVALRALCSGGADQPAWLSTLETTKWFTYLSAILKSALVAVNSIDKEGKPVLVHCSDGWDRTTQIIALTELLLDPYYRTLEGFQVLVEREWLDYGHKFGDRCGNGINTEDLNERCPVFLQWLDCVYQLYHQFPCAFQFNEAYLVKLMQHTYSHLFGTFLCNNTRERESNQLNLRTASVWSLLNNKNNKFTNHLYCPSLEQQVLYPSYNVRSLQLWASVYLSNNLSRTSSEDLSADKQEQEPSCMTCNLHKTRSCENLLANQEAPVPSPSRRKSDPSIALENFDQAVHQTKDTSHHVLSDFKDIVDRRDVNDSKIPKSIPLENGHGPLMGNGVVQNGNSNDLNKSDNLDNQILVNGHSELTPDCDDKLGKNIVQNGHMNGNTSDSDNESGGSPVRTLGKTNSEKTLCDKNGIESSTDTLVDENDLSKINGRLKIVSRSVENLIPAKTAIDKLKSLESSSTISTSTSEISNSSIELSGSTSDGDNLRNLTCLLHQSNALKLSYKTNGCVKQLTNGSLSPNRLYPTPASSRTPNSTCPPTPGADSKSTTESHIHRQLNGISRYLDVDGLTIFNEPVQQRMLQVKSDYERQIQLLTSQLEETRAALIHHASACNGAGRCLLDNLRDDLLMSPDSNGEMNSLGGCSNASDVSWEQLDESDAKIVKWVPDYVATHCAGCNSGFNLMKRKHHCRNCGNIFCHECSNNYTPIPHQNLAGEERVCFKCFSFLQKLPFNGMIDERPLAAAASN
ncbi:myotubularin-related protein 3/4 [Mytilus galloprovincialis]|uniref:phosphatidylinositol-3,5-bisphosphate 3-phosphatase n=3 Tax=Mytilus galloprovincialis TaxID=29158 RepID=A0A8B6HGL3_MYTGA|nr:myotubularin-related protein 3/4 [Mytilus galloprovincialis]